MSNLSFVDSHCHLTNAAFVNDKEDVIGRAWEANLSSLLTIAVDLEDCEQVLSVTQRHERIFCSQGVHPHETEPFGGAKTFLQMKRRLEKSLENPKVVALGETGLDYHYNHSAHDAQIEALRVHIQLHQATGLPLIIHSRNGEEDLLKIFAQEDVKVTQGKAPGVIHSFSGSAAFAHACLERGFYISASGISTFKNAESIRDVLKTVPLNRLLIETDSPYLAPPPYRGKRNEPMHVCEVAQVMADIHQISLEQMAFHTTENFHRLFWKVPR